MWQLSGQHFCFECKRYWIKTARRKQAQWFKFFEVSLTPMNGGIYGFPQSLRNIRFYGYDDYCRLWHHTAWQNFTNVSEKLTTFIKYTHVASWNSRIAQPHRVPQHEANRFIRNLIQRFCCIFVRDNGVFDTRIRGPCALYSFSNKISRLCDHSADSVTVYTPLSQTTEIHGTWDERYVTESNPNVVLLNLVQQK
jgi:hypothetical protein